MKEILRYSLGADNSLLAGSVNHQIMALPFREPSQLNPHLGWNP